MDKTWVLYKEENNVIKDLKVGDKVVPISKSAYKNFQYCEHWKKAQDNGQNYLIIAHIYSDGDIACSFEGKTKTASVYREQDLVPLEEYRKKEPKEPEAELFTLQKLIDLHNLGILKGSDTFYVRRA